MFPFFSGKFQVGEIEYIIWPDVLGCPVGS